MPAKKSINENFFKEWTSEMAYVLGFFIADGNMSRNKRGSCYIEFHITDKEILEKMRTALKSSHKISERKKIYGHKKVYRLQIGSKLLFENLMSLGVFPRKSKKIRLPSIPDGLFNHFLRGYFDGDGCVYFGRRKDRNNKNGILQVEFVSGSKIFLKQLHKEIASKIGTKGGSKFFANGAYRLKFSIKDSVRLYEFMYRDVKSGLLLKRKRDIFEKYFKMDR